MKVTVRLDDITPDMDWQRFQDFKALLDKYEIRPLIGVIPDNHDDTIRVEESSHPEFWSYIKELQQQGWVIAMHGWRHIYSTRKGGVFPLNNFSEFAGIPYEEQEKMLRMGKERLKEKGIDTEIFMAPAHSYDRNTLKALRSTGFKAVTDGFGTQPYDWQGLTFYPISFHLADTLQKKNGFSTMVVHTGTVSEEDLIRYEDYFKRDGVTWISYEEYMKQPAVRRTVFGSIKEFWMAKGKYMISKIR